jgi:hypothetical protein
LAYCLHYECCPNSSCQRGGAHLKISKLLFLVLAAGIFSAAAWADPIDPTITIKKGGGSPTTTHGAAQSDPIILMDGFGSQDFLYEGVATNFLFIEVIPGANDEGGAKFLSELFTCAPGLATECFAVSPKQIPAVEFAFLAPTGVFVPGLDVQVLEISAPEPTTILMLGLGMAGLMLLGKKRLNLVANQT